MNPQNKAFSLVGLITLIVIIVLFLAILLPSLQRSRNQAEQTACLSSMKYWHMANTMYAANNNDYILGNNAQVDDPNKQQPEWWNKLAYYFGNHSSSHNSSYSEYPEELNLKATAIIYKQIGKMRCPTVAPRYAYQINAYKPSAPQLAALLHNENTLSYVAVNDIFSPTSSQEFGHTQNHTHPGADGNHRMIKFFEVPHPNRLVLYGDGYINFNPNPTSPNFDGHNPNTYPPKKQGLRGYEATQNDTTHGPPLSPLGSRLATVHNGACNTVFVDGHGAPTTFPMTAIMYDSWDEAPQANQIQQRTQ